jgi:serine/threonine-protein kinase
MLYEMLCGQVPFDAEVFGVVEVVFMHLRDDPQPLREVDPDISEELEKIVMKMLIKDPNKRPTAQELAEELATMLDIHLPQEKVITGSVNVEVAVSSSSKSRTNDLTKEM